MYAGVGSRSTPGDVLDEMRVLAGRLAAAGHTLRTGGSSGADEAFLAGARTAGGQFEVHLPWYGFNGMGYSTNIHAYSSQQARMVAAAAHPAWDSLSDQTKRILTRNAVVVLGPDCNEPVEFVVCWAPGPSSREGGTNHTRRIAEAHGIPEVNLAATLPGVRGSADSLIRHALEHRAR